MKRRKIKQERGTMFMTNDVEASGGQLSEVNKKKKTEKVILIDTCPSFGGG
jgi:hypothetical protein